MSDVVTSQDLHRELGIHEQTVRSRIQEFFGERSDEDEPLTRAQADEFLAWHANRFGTTG